MGASSANIGGGGEAGKVMTRFDARLWGLSFTCCKLGFPIIASSLCPNLFFSAGEEKSYFISSVLLTFLHISLWVCISDGRFYTKMTN